MSRVVLQRIRANRLRWFLLAVERPRNLLIEIGHASSDEALVVFFKRHIALCSGPLF